MINLNCSNRRTPNPMSYHATSIICFGPKETELGRFSLIKPNPKLDRALVKTLVDSAIIEWSDGEQSALIFV
jgi:hypothetical protein